MEQLLTLSNKLFIKKFQKIIENVNDRLSDYLEDPNENNIHDIRIAIRRLGTLNKILPKRIRKESILQNYVNKSLRVFKINTEVRDFDIICKKLENYPSNSLCRKLVISLKKKRVLKLKKARTVAYELKGLSLLKIEKIDVSNSKIEKRLYKILNRLIKLIGQNVPLVLDDEKKIEELHTLRKDLKKLRYSIELTSNDEYTSGFIYELKKMQDLLGEIHDSDIMIDYIKSVRKLTVLTDIINGEIAGRGEKYKVFVKTFENNASNLKRLIQER